MVTHRSAAAESGRPALLAQIRALIAAEGPITFDRFMDLALYAPGLGYYVTLSDAPSASGALADYQTSPQVHPLFGHLLARELVRIWEALDRPSPFGLAEPGAGAGELADQILAGLAEQAPGLRVEYHALDPRLAGAAGPNAQRDDRARNGEPRRDAEDAENGGEGRGEGLPGLEGGRATSAVNGAGDGGRKPGTRDWPSSPSSPGRTRGDDARPSERGGPACGPSHKPPTPNASDRDVSEPDRPFPGALAPPVLPRPFKAGIPGHPTTRRFRQITAALPTPWPSLAALADAGIRVHCVLSNELFDALPVQRVTWREGKLQEIYVDWGGRGFVERVGPLSDPRLAEWVAARGPEPAEGWRGEVCLRLEPTLTAIARLIPRGVVLTIDYGYGALAADPVPAAETLVAYHRHQWNDAVYDRVGQQDLTSHVDFGAFRRVAQTLGLARAGATTQRQWLLDLGLATATERWAAREPTPGRQWQTRFAATELVRPAGLGRLKVVALQRGVPGYCLTAAT